jgi:hypothetical protein
MPPEIEAELGQALALLTSAFGSQPPPSVASTNGVPAQPQLQPEAAPQPEAAMTEPTTSGQPPAPEAALPETSATSSTGHWAFDPAIGWMWLSDVGSPVATMPMIEVYPGGVVTIQSKSRSARPGVSGRKGPPPPPPQAPKP